jgi:hypothetical protein
MVTMVTAAQPYKLKIIYDKSGLLEPFGYTCACRPLKSSLGYKCHPLRFNLYTIG